MAVPMLPLKVTSSFFFFIVQESFFVLVVPLLFLVWSRRIWSRVVTKVEGFVLRRFLLVMVGGAMHIAPSFLLVRGIASDMLNMIQR